MPRACQSANIHSITRTVAAKAAAVASAERADRDRADDPRRGPVDLRVATAPAASPTGDTQRTGDSALASGFAANDGASSSSSTSNAESRPIDAAAPAVLRLGISFLAGFALGFLMRSFLRWSILIVGVVAVAIYLLKRSGMIDLPWESIEGDVRDGASWLKSQVGGIKDVLAGYLPSSGAAVLGIIFGMRR